MATFSERKTALDEVAARLSAEGKRAANGISAIKVALDSLAMMEADYTAVFNDISNDAGNDAATLVQKAEVTNLTAEFLAKKAEVQAVMDAIDAL